MVNPYTEILSTWTKAGHAIHGDYHRLLVNYSLKYIPVLLISWKGLEILHQSGKYMAITLKAEIFESYKLDVSIGAYHSNLLEQIHCFKSWWKENLSREAAGRYPLDGFIYFSIVLLPSDSVKDLRSSKNYLRSVLGGKHVFHLSDPDCPLHIGGGCNCTVESSALLLEFCRQSNMLFHSNTRRYLSYKLPGNRGSYLKNIESFANSVIDKSDILIDNSGSMAAYGLRDSRDIDFLHRSDWHIVNDSIECHNVTFGVDAYKLYGQLLGIEKTDMFNDYNHFFYAYGFKHLILEHVASFKQLRLNGGLNRPKDHLDIKMIQDFNKVLGNLDESAQPTRVS